MATIKLESGSFSAAAGNVIASASSLAGVNAGEVTAGACSGLVLTEYVQTFERIIALVSKYARLVEKDGGDMQTTAESLEKADMNAAGGWR